MLLIGSEASDHVSVRLIARDNPNSRDFFDGNWIKGHAELKSGAFSAAADVTLRAEAFAELRNQLQAIVEKGKGVARFAPMEPWLTIGIQRDCFETLEAVVSLRDKLDAGNELRARFQIDAELLPTMLAELDRIIEAFPVVGR
jgi:hypothetical protein